MDVSAGIANWGLLYLIDKRHAQHSTILLCFDSRNRMLISSWEVPSNFLLSRKSFNALILGTSRKLTMLSIRCRMRFNIDPMTWLHRFRKRNHSYALALHSFLLEELWLGVGSNLRFVELGLKRYCSSVLLRLVLFDSIDVKIWVQTSSCWLGVMALVSALSGKVAGLRKLQMRDFDSVTLSCPVLWLFLFRNRCMLRHTRVGIVLCSIC